MKIYLSTFFILLTINLMAQNQSASQKPSWLDDAGKPLSVYYDYFIGFGENDNLQKAREKSIDDVYTQISDEIKSSYKVGGFSKTEIKNKQQGSNVETKVDFEFVGTVEKTGEQITVSGIKEVEYYWVKNGASYQYSVLLRKPKTGKSDPKLPLFTLDKSAVWRSVVYAGWGQMYSRKSSKGVALLCGETAGLAGVIIGQILYAKNIDKANKTTSQNRQVYLDYAKNCETIRNISGIVAGVVWIYNIIDATSSAKPKIYSYQQHKKFEIFPDINKQYCQLTIHYNFK